MLTSQQLREFVLANPDLVNIKPSVKYPELLVVKYKNKVFYDNLWTPELQELRGLVIDNDWNIISRPFIKIFNRHENGTDIPLDEVVDATRKINGFMACVSEYNGRNIISTTGSLDSEFVFLAEKYLRDLPIPSIWSNYTFIFEICDPQDPHIVTELPGAYLIGVRDIDTGMLVDEHLLDNMAPALTDTSAMDVDIRRPDRWSCTFGEIIEMARRATHEGFVVRGKTTTLKIKTPYYLTTKFLARKNPEKLAVMLNDPYELMKTIDEEFYPLIQHLSENADSFLELDEQSRVAYIQKFIAASY